jgi:glycolate oxidase FAD binding subunit
LNPGLHDIPNLNLTNWEDLDAQWQRRIEGAILATNPPDCLAFPETPESLAAAVKFASDSGWKLLPCGSGSKLSWGGLVRKATLAISTQRLNRIVEHAAGDLTVTVEAGVKLAKLQQALQASRQFLPLNPAYPESATIGGIIATADSGSWRQRYGGVRDLILGLSFVRADGAEAKAGGRVVKNVAGYDLMKLFTGSYGTLGIITQVTFRLYPLPEASATLAMAGDKEAIAVAAQTLRQSGLTPTAAELLSPAVVKGLDLGEGMGLIVRFQSIPESVAEQLQQVSGIAEKLGLRVSYYREAEETSLWQRLADSLRRPTSEAAVTCKIGVMPDCAAQFLAQLDALLGDGGWGKVNLSSGLGWLHLPTIAAVSYLEKLRLLCQEERGFLTILESPAAVKQQVEPWGYTGNALDMMRKIKEKFDPQALLSPGRFWN